MFVVIQESDSSREMIMIELTIVNKSDWSNRHQLLSHSGVNLKYVTRGLELSCPLTLLPRTNLLQSDRMNRVMGLEVEGWTLDVWMN